MLKKLFLKAVNKYASKWLLLFVVVLLLCTSFVLSYFIYFDFRLNMDFYQLSNQLPFIIIIGGFSFFIVGSYKGYLDIGRLKIKIFASIIR
jgi:hypothetical protein